MRQEKEIRKDWEERKGSFFCWWSDHLGRKSERIHTHTHTQILKLKSDHSNVSGYQVNEQNWITFMYPRNKQV